MSPSEYKEVYFGEYCKKCVNKSLDEHEDPCNECLTSPVNLYSHKPIHFEDESNG